MAESIIRVQRRTGYTVLPNATLRDHRLSLKTRAILAIMISVPDDWDFTVAGLAAICGCGRDSVRGSLVELERAGYLTRRQMHNEAGHFSRNEYIVTDTPVKKPVTDEGKTPLPEKPLTAEPLTGNPTEQNKDITNIPPIVPPQGAPPPKKRRNRGAATEGESAEISSRVMEYATGDQALQEAIMGLLENRQVANRKPVRTLKALNGILRDLDVHSGGDRRVKLMMLDKAIKHSWLTVYALKPDELPAAPAAQPLRGEGVTYL